MSTFSTKYFPAAARNLVPAVVEAEVQVVRIAGLLAN